MKRVFPNGTGFVAILGLLLGWAWIDPKAAVSGGPVITGLFANFLIVVIFFLQGWRLRPARMFEVWADGYTLWITQIAIIATPVALVLSGWAVGVISEEKLSPFLLLACLPTTISSCVVYARGAGGDGDYALGPCDPVKFASAVPGSSGLVLPDSAERSRSFPHDERPDGSGSQYVASGWAALFLRMVVSKGGHPKAQTPCRMVGG